MEALIPGNIATGRIAGGRIVQEREAPGSAIRQPRQRVGIEV